MKLPHQSNPVARSQSPRKPAEQMNAVALSKVRASGFLCGPCKEAVKLAGKAVIGEGCAVADTAFEVACNAALDWIPGVGEGPSEAACIAGGVALGAACEAAGGTVTQGAIDSAADKVCSFLC